MRSIENSFYPILLWCLLIIKALAMVGVILYAGIGLGPDEAQYWTWSRKLDLGYYSKPPGIAWEIWFGCLFFGNTELGVRFGAILLSIGLSWAVYWLARCCGLKPATAFWAGLVMAFCPLGILSSFFATTDVGYVLFWTLASALMADGLNHKKPPQYLVLGLVIAFGALFKWPMYYFWIAVWILVAFYPFLRHRNLFGGMLISLLGILPSIYWNASRDWPTFQHVWSTIKGGHGSSASSKIIHGNFWDFFGAQAALLSPILFFLLLLAFLALLRYRKQIPLPMSICGWGCLFILLIYMGLSVFQKMQGNWAVFAYPLGIVFLCWYACEKMVWGKGWLALGLMISVLLSAVAISIPYIQSHAVIKQHPIPYSWNPFRECLGWNSLSKILLDAGYDPSHHFLFGDRYQMTSLLSFYGPEQKRAYFFNLGGARKNQFSYWPSMKDEQIGKTGYFVFSLQSPRLEKEAMTLLDHYQTTLSKYFQNVRFVGLMPLYVSDGKMAKGVLVFECNHYHGLEPSTSLFY